MTAHELMAAREKPCPAAGPREPVPYSPQATAWNGNGGVSFQQPVAWNLLTRRASEGDARASSLARQISMTAAGRIGGDSSRRRNLRRMLEMCD